MTRIWTLQQEVLTAMTVVSTQHRVETVIKLIEEQYPADKTSHC